VCALAVLTKVVVGDMSVFSIILFSLVAVLNHNFFFSNHLCSSFALRLGVFLSTLSRTLALIPLAGVLPRLAWRGS
jgi:hypothetical protein